MRIYNGILSDCKRFAYSYLSPKNYIVFNFCSSGNTYLSCKQTIFSNLCIMTDMYKVIDLGSGANHCITAYPTINCTISSYLYKIFDHNSATTVHFFIMNIPVGFFIIIKCIATNNSTCLYNNIIAYHTMIQNGNIGMNNAIITDSYMIADKSIRHYNCVLPN